MSKNYHNNRNKSYRGRGKKSVNPENREHYNQQEAREIYRERRARENRENSDHHENEQVRENYDRKENHNSHDNQSISSFVLGEKELEGKNAQFQYDKGWYSITDIVGEEKTLVYKSKNAQEAYTKWNVYIGRKKERPQRMEKAEN